MTGRPATRTRGFGTRLVSGSSRVPFPASGTMTFMSHPPVAVGPGPDQLVAPGLLHAVGEGGHERLQVRNAECGVRSVRASVVVIDPTLQLRIPHSALRILFIRG